jgi:hypothetical protein
MVRRHRDDDPALRSGHVDVEALMQGAGQQISHDQKHDRDPAARGAQANRSIVDRSEGQ